YPISQEADPLILKDFKQIQAIITEVRNVRNSKQISPKEPLPLSFKVGATINYKSYEELISKLANLSELTAVNENVNGGLGFLVGRDEFFVSIQQNIDAEAERERIQKEIGYLNGFLKSVNAKL